MGDFSIMGEGVQTHRQTNRPGLGAGASEKKGRGRVITIEKCSCGINGHVPKLFH